MATYNVLVFGASYGSLLAAKVLGAGHAVTLVCRASTAQLINAEGIRVRMPASAAGDAVEIDSRQLPGRLRAAAPDEADVADHDLVVFAMQEPQYRAPELRDALRDVARNKIACMSIMNMPPLAYLARVPEMPMQSLRAAYTDWTVWQDFEPGRMTLCSPDPQAFRPANEKPNVLEVRLATNFKTARFASDDHNAMLDCLERDIEAARFPMGDSETSLPVKLKVHDSLFVPFAKWSMLLAGNYRCVLEGGTRSIAAAVHEDAATARTVYEWVGELCRALGANAADLVPFDKYAAAAASLTAPSSAARALAGGAIHIERVDRLVQIVAASQGMRLSELDRTVDLIDAWLASNREKQHESTDRPFTQRRSAARAAASL
ncbi:MAG TPA: hypothetical protein VJ891_14075 [Casimicrobiaceae bacterium]|nr:hypothetical protein [Casimicrobiaceae bacterium]